ncbi:TauD/TfdA family dioxygenase [Rhodobium gokarnense]|uniref:Alpha-ketoglutarate-dependent taurine dioxygenase n=1 Tax=Rhodobium gokarnense TaxID=364296 RepID=A0ABT3H7C6_9HYPH|nr:TauD/TfdA family dioxygenase [Rhodobium gokarnense]MCW2306295.1 alpha-ketoglutarate-dependent taurine dioxygenase [Rhodobium gokarnense]
MIGSTALPFDLGNDAAYQAWRAEKLANFPKSAAELIVEVGNIGAVTAAERAAIVDLNARANMAIYRCRSHCDDPATVRQRLRAFAEIFGLRHLEAHRSMDEEGLVALEVVREGQGGRHGFIPYTDKPIRWHTDGYYNPPEAPIRAMLLHCVRPAAEGGENGLFDPEIAYIRLRDRDPALIKALMHEDAMAIPEHVEPDGSTRPRATGPVFSLDPATGALLMRFTERKRNIVWRENAETTEAVAALRDILQSDDPLLFRYRLGAGEGVICNNVLHDRTGFVDDHRPGRTRLYFRARYIDRIGVRSAAAA